MLIGATVLLVGTLTYLIDRPPNQTDVVPPGPASFSFYSSSLRLLGSIENSLLVRAPQLGGAARVMGHRGL